MLDPLEIAILSEMYEERQRENQSVLKKCVYNLHQTRNTGTSILLTLEQQKEQLLRVNNDTNVIDDSLNRSQRTLRGMKSMWGAFINRITSYKPKNYPNIFAFSTTNNIAIKPINNIESKEKDSINTEDDKCLDEISLLLKDLKEQSKQMNTELQIHNKIIDNIDDKVVNSTGKLKTMNKTMKSIN